VKRESKGKFSEWSYEAVRRLIIRETGIKLTYRFVAEYLDEWNMPHPMAGQVPPPRKARPTEGQEAIRPDNAGAPARHRVNEEDSETFSLAEYEAAIAEARKNLKLQEPPAHGKRTGRHARQRSAPTQKKRKQKSRRKRR
jgi:hypothetical protein